MRTAIFALALLVFPLTAQEPQPPDLSDIAVMRGLLAEQLQPVTQKMAEMVKIMQQQEAELKGLHEQIGKLQGCKKP